MAVSDLFAPIKMETKKIESYYNTLINEKDKYFIVNPDKSISNFLPKTAISIIPGSFNPLHNGHKHLFLESNKNNN